MKVPTTVNISDFKSGYYKPRLQPAKALARTWPLPTLTASEKRKAGAQMFNAQEWKKFLGCVDAEIAAAGGDMARQYLLKVAKFGAYWRQPKAESSFKPGDQDPLISILTTAKQILDDKELVITFELANMMQWAIDGMTHGLSTYGLETVGEIWSKALSTSWTKSRAGLDKVLEETKVCIIACVKRGDLKTLVDVCNLMSRGLKDKPKQGKVHAPWILVWARYMRAEIDKLDIVGRLAKSGVALIKRDLGPEGWATVSTGTADFAARVYACHPSHDSIGSVSEPDGVLGFLPHDHPHYKRLGLAMLLRQDRNANGAESHHLFDTLSDADLTLNTELWKMAVIDSHRHESFVSHLGDGPLLEEVTRRHPGYATDCVANRADNFDPATTSPAQKVSLMVSYIRNFGGRVRRDPLLDAIPKLCRLAGYTRLFEDLVEMIDSIPPDDSSHIEEQLVAMYEEKVQKQVDDDVELLWRLRLWVFIGKMRMYKASHTLVKCNDCVPKSRFFNNIKYSLSELASNRKLVAAMKTNREEAQGLVAEMTLVISIMLMLSFESLDSDHTAGYPLAMGLLERQLSITPENQSIIFALVRIHCLMGNITRAHKLWQKLAVKRATLPYLGVLFYHNLSQVYPSVEGLGDELERMITPSSYNIPHRNCALVADALWEGNYSSAANIYNFLHKPKDIGSWPVAVTNISRINRMGACKPVPMAPLSLQTMIVDDTMAFPRGVFPQWCPYVTNSPSYCLLDVPSNVPASIIVGHTTQHLFAILSNYLKPGGLQAFVTQEMIEMARFALRLEAFDNLRASDENTVMTTRAVCDILALCNQVRKSDVDLSVRTLILPLIDDILKGVDAMVGATEEGTTPDGDGAKAAFEFLRILHKLRFLAVFHEMGAMVVQLANVLGDAKISTSRQTRAFLNAQAQRLRAYNIASQAGAAKRLIEFARKVLVRPDFVEIVVANCSKEFDECFGEDPDGVLASALRNAVCLAKQGWQNTFDVWAKVKWEF